MKNIYSVGQINSYIRNMFTQDFMMQSVWIRGEVSNCKYHSSGHIYFTLKDKNGTIACVMFAGNRKGLNFSMTEGQQVIVGGNIDVYERDGKYQLYAKEISLDGIGQLYEKFEQLKRELEEQGMFSGEYKQSLPKYINRLGVITAPTGAAVRDIIQISSRRNPYVQIILYPAIVQGELAPVSIVNGIHAMERLHVDTIIVGRGGGSIEDLWAFNERIVAQAIFDCRVPIISAVGHETDTTIADFVADMRAPTPSAAAELAVYEYDSFVKKCGQYEELLQRNMYHNIECQKSKSRFFKAGLKTVSPLGKLRQKQTYLLKLEENLSDSMQSVLIRKRHAFELYVEKMKGLSPLDKLQHGYSYVTDESGKAVTDIEQIKEMDLLQVYMLNGIVRARVEAKERKEHGQGNFSGGSIFTD